MAWELRAARSFSVSEFGVYKGLTFPVDPLDLAWAVSMEYPGDAAPGRLRTGFYYPYVLVDGRQLFGPSEEMMLRQAGEDRALYLLDYGFLDGWPGLESEVTQYAVSLAPDRGILPATSLLWRYR